MQILYTREELGRKFRWFPAWIAAAVVLEIARHLWLPQGLGATAVACGMLGVSLWFISQSRTSSDARSVALTLGLISGLFCVMLLLIRFFRMRNVAGPRLFVAIDFAFGARIFLQQLVVLASVYVCHGQLDEGEESESDREVWMHTPDAVEHSA